MDGRQHECHPKCRQWWHLQRDCHSCQWLYRYIERHDKQHTNHTDGIYCPDSEQ